MSSLQRRAGVVTRAAVAGSSVALIALVFVVGAGLARGYRPVIITTGSMAPTAPPGALVIAGPSSDVEVGDLLVMRTEGRATVTHRVVEIEPNPAGSPFALTRGDANSTIDAAPYPLGSSELIGRWIVPGLGRLLMVFASPVLAVGLVTLAVAVVTATLLGRIWRRGAESSPTASTDAIESAHEATGSAMMRGVGAATVVAVLLGTGGIAWSLYLGVAAVGGNLFSSNDCYDARLGSVQSGQLVSTANGIQTASIAAVDTSTSFLIFSISSSAGGPSDATVMGHLAGPTTIEFTRQTTSGAPPPVAIEWSIVEYACGVSVQRGVGNGNGTNQLDFSVTPVDPTSSLVLASSVSAPGDVSYDADDLQIVELVGADTVRVRADGSGSFSPNRRFAWQVVTYTGPGDAAVQNVTTTLGSSVGTATITLPTPVDPATTLVLASSTSPGIGPDIGERMVRVRLVDPSTVEVTRLVATDSIDVAVQVVELSDGSIVRRGVLDLAPAEYDGTATIPPVDLSRSVAFSTVMVPGSMSGGATDHVSGDVVGEASAVVTLTDPTTVAVSRDSAVSQASFPWQVVTWGGPSWADPLSPFRQRIDITAGGVDAPDGYSTSLTFDHAALVTSGLAMASGDDARVWRYDGASWTELDRVLDDIGLWNAIDTTIWFRTQEPLSATETVSYWLYFGNAAPPPVLADPANVWLLQEGFEAGALGQFEDRTAGTGWYRALPWTRRMVIMVDSAAVDSDLLDQRVLVRVTDADLAANAQADGADLRFIGVDGVTALPHEIEEWDPLTGSLTAWVRVPVVESSSDTTMYLYYGASDAPSQERPRSVWTDDVAVWHFSRDPAGPAPTLDDVGPRGMDGLALGNPTMVAATSGPAADLDGSTDRFEAAPSNVSAGPFTVAAWFRADTAGGDPVLVSQGDPTGSGSFELAIDTSLSPTGRFRIRTAGSVHEVLAGSISLGTWHHLVASWDGLNATLYLDGLPVGSTAATGIGVDGSAIPVVLGGDAGGLRTFDGLLGEMHLATGAWGVDEVSFHEANLRLPGATVSASAPSVGVWFDQGDWSIRRPLVIDHRQVAGPLIDFPFLVQLSDIDLGINAQTDGDDLVFVAGDGVTRLDHQIEAWNPSSGALSVWVRIPVLDDTVDTPLFLYLANVYAADQSDPVGVWGPDADLVMIGN